MNEQNKTIQKLIDLGFRLNPEIQKDELGNYFYLTKTIYDKSGGISEYIIIKIYNF